MKRFILFWGLLCAVAFPFYAQNWTTQDSLRLQQLLKGEGEVKLNPDVLKEIEMGSLLGTPKAVKNKPWLDFDDTLPASLPGEPKKQSDCHCVLIRQIPNITGTRFIRRK